MNTPFVSVIAPVYNDQKLVKLLIESLVAQNYPKELYEIIIVDNGSTDTTKDIIRQYPVILLEENEIQSSYAARNKGMGQAKGEVIAFIDSDCIADPNWLKEGVRALESADLIGGRVEFYFSDKKSAAEYYDTLIHLQFNHSISDRKVAGTCNLFTKRKVFDKIGLFPSHVKSGGDFQWTGKATGSGFSLIYDPAAIVKHPTRSLRELIKKHLRTGGGKPYVWQTNGESIWKWRLFLTLISPPGFSYIRRLINERGKPEMNEKFWGIWITCYVCQFFFLFGILGSIGKIVLGGPKK